MSLGSYDVADTDLGFQLEGSNVKGIYSPQLIVWHQEGNHLRTTMKKFYSKGVLAGKIATKWQLTNEFVAKYINNLVDQLRLLKNLPLQFRLLTNFDAGITKKNYHLCTHEITRTSVQQGL